MKKIFIGLLVLTVFFLLVPNAALAADDINGQDYFAVPEFEKDNSEFPTLNFNIDSASTYFFSTSCSISKLSNTSIEGNVTTYARQIVDRIGYVLYFQRLDAGKWVTIETRSNSYNNRSYLNLNHFISVDRNQTYRVYARHYITHNNKTYYQTTISNSIYL